MKKPIPFYRTIPGELLLGALTFVILWIVIALTGCRSAKIASSRQKSSEQVSNQIEVKKQENTMATVATTTQEDLRKEGYNSWSIALSLDSDAVPFSFTLPDGSILAGRSKSFSGTGKMTEARATSTQQQSSEQRQVNSDSTAKQQIQKSEEVQTKTVERKASSFWRPVAIGAVVIILLVGAFLYFKPRFL